MANKKNYNVWIPIDIMKDPRTEKLIQECGYKGLGVLLALIVAYEQCYHIHPEIDVIMTIVGRNIPTKFKKKILLDYGFFGVNSDGTVENILPAHTRTNTCTNTCANTCAEVRGPLPLLTNLNKQETTDQKDNIAAADAADVADAAVGFIKKVLLKPEASLWKQTLLMQCPYSSLLSLYWSQAGILGVSGRIVPTAAAH